MLAQQLSIAGVGEALWDVFQHNEEFGGAPANFVSHCSMLGERGFLVSAVGTDQRGRRALERMTELGVNLEYCAVIDGMETGVSTVVLDSKKTRNMKSKRMLPGMSYVTTQLYFHFSNLWTPFALEL